MVTDDMKTKTKYMVGGGDYICKIQFNLLCGHEKGFPKEEHKHKKTCLYRCNCCLFSRQDVTCSTVFHIDFTVWVIRVRHHLNLNGTMGLVDNSEWM